MVGFDVLPAPDWPLVAAASIVSVPPAIGAILNRTAAAKMSTAVPPEFSKTDEIGLEVSFRFSVKSGSGKGSPCSNRHVSFRSGLLSLRFGSVDGDPGEVRCGWCPDPGGEHNTR